MKCATVVARAAACLVGLAVVACAGVTAGVGARAEQGVPPELARRLTPEFRRERVAPAHSSRSVMGTDMLRGNPQHTACELVERLWPNVLRPPAEHLAPGHGDPRGDVVGVYASGGWIGGQETLRSVTAGQVLILYRLTPQQEFARYGRRHAGGGVEIVWRPPSAP